MTSVISLGGFPTISMPLTPILLHKTSRTLEEVGVGLKIDMHHICFHKYSSIVAEIVMLKWVRNIY